MAKKTNKSKVATPAVATQTGTCCRIESVITVDQRGQMVLPKDVREKAGIRAGDKLAVVGWGQDGRLCCLALVKVADIGAILKDVLGPVVKDLPS